MSSIRAMRRRNARAAVRSELRGYLEAEISSPEGRKILTELCVNKQPGTDLLTSILHHLRELTEQRRASHHRP